MESFYYTFATPSPYSRSSSVFGDIKLDREMDKEQILKFYHKLLAKQFKR